MSAHPGRPDAAPQPTILAITATQEPDDIDVTRPDPRMKMKLIIPPSDGPLDLRIAWYPPAHAARVRERPGEFRFIAMNGWIGLVTLRKRADGSTGPGSP